LKILDKSTPVLYNINNHYCYYRRKECAYGCIKIQQTARIHQGISDDTHRPPHS
jgi:hypothetical protein